VLSEKKMLKSAASTPEEIVIVADSDTRMVAAVAELDTFSAIEKEDDEVNTGGVVSATVKVVGLRLETGTITYEL
jgi:hypothetical protein